MSRERDTSNGVRHWLHPITKGSRKDEHRANLTVRAMAFSSILSCLRKMRERNAEINAMHTTQSILG